MNRRQSPRRATSSTWPGLRRPRQPYSACRGVYTPGRPRGTVGSAQTRTPSPAVLSPPYSPASPTFRVRTASRATMMRTSVRLSVEKRGLTARKPRFQTAAHTRHRRRVPRRLSTANGVGHVRHLDHPYRARTPLRNNAVNCRPRGAPSGALSLHQVQRLAVGADLSSTVRSTVRPYRHQRLQGGKVCRDGCGGRGARLSQGDGAARDTRTLSRILAR